MGVSGASAVTLRVPLMVAFGVSAAVLISIAVYNDLVASRRRCDQAFADVDVQLKQRFDLVPNLGASLDRLIDVAEAYPELKTSESFAGLRAELCDLENKIAATRRYN